MILPNQKLTKFMDEIIKIPNCHEPTRSYIIGVLSSPTLEVDLTGQSLTLALKKAYDAMDFESFKNIGDYLFFIRSLFPHSLQGADLNYYDSIAQTSYYRCFMILNRRWYLYEELADQFPIYTKVVHQLLNSTKSGLFPLSNRFFKLKLE